MEKSIETIWKKGFLESDALVAPKINNLYSQKSKTIIDRLKRMMKINTYVIAIFAVLNTGLYAFLGTPYTGLFLFFLFMVACWVSIRQEKSLKNIDINLSSYEYLKSFNDRLKSAISGNAKAMRFLYPLAFIACLMPIVHSLKKVDVTREAILNSGLHLTYGIPTVAWAVAILIAIVMYIFGKKIYYWDVNLVYNRIFKKIESMINEMEELRK